MSTQVTASELPKSIAQTDENINHIFEQSSSLPMQVAGLSDGEISEKGGILPAIFFAPAAFNCATVFWAGVAFGGGAGGAYMVKYAMR